jgi:hypothetical protein
MGGRKAFTPEQGIGKPREAEVLLSKGSSGAAVCRTIEEEGQILFVAFGSELQ